jgi:hypothetical protein
VIDRTEIENFFEDNNEPWINKILKETSILTHTEKKCFYLILSESLRNWDEQELEER